MKLSSILNNNVPSLSFEVFPPKTDTSFDSVKSAVEEIAELHPSFMSVTYGAGGGTSRYTLDIAKNILEEHGVPTLAHLTCVSSTKETVRSMISAIREAGIENVMALRGDIPQEMENSDRSQWHYSHAVELVREIKSACPDLCVGGACYPEIHPESTDQRDDIKYLKEKVDAGCEFLTTQMFFDNDIIYRYMDELSRVGIDVPVVPGIMPVTNAKQIQRIISISGNALPSKFMRIIERYGDRPEAMKQAGIAFATEQIVDLYAGGFNAVHVYSMNKPDVAMAIQNNVSSIIKG